MRSLLKHVSDHCIVRISGLSVVGNNNFIYLLRPFVVHLPSGLKLDKYKLFPVYVATLCIDSFVDLPFKSLCKPHADLLRSHCLVYDVNQRNSRNILIVPSPRLQSRTRALAVLGVPESALVRPYLPLKNRDIGG